MSGCHLTDPCDGDSAEFHCFMELFRTGQAISTGVAGLAFALLGNQTAQQTAATCLAPPSWDWERFIRLATRTNILPALDPYFLNPSSSDQIPPEVLTLLSTVHALNLERNQLALAQAHEIATALNQVGIQPVALKGLANILTGIYPDLGTCYLADIDLLRPARPTLLAAAVIQQNLGYKTLNPRHPSKLSIGHAYPPLTRPNSLEVDLHRTTGLGICPSFLPPSELIAHASPFDLDGATILLPSPEYLITHHIMHCQMHDWYSNRITPPLRSMYDMFLLNRHFTPTVANWPSIEQRFRANGQLGVLQLYLKRVSETMSFASPIPLHPDVITRLRWARCNALDRFPVLRFLDSLYFWKAGVLPRTRRVREIVATSGGWRYLLGSSSPAASTNDFASDFSLPANYSLQCSSSKPCPFGKPA